MYYNPSIGNEVKKKGQVGKITTKTATKAATGAHQIAVHRRAAFRRCLSAKAVTRK
jgi:hypothetical protein